jgi:hypothetical protein
MHMHDNSLYLLNIYSLTHVYDTINKWGICVETKSYQFIIST